MSVHEQMGKIEPSPARTKTIIKPSKGWVSLGLGELWAYQELRFFPQLL
jgi:hypothetical protein